MSAASAGQVGSRVAVSRDGSHLLRGGHPWMLVADTIWMAFTHVLADEWDACVAIRAGQGFSALNISLLPIVNEVSAVGDRPPEPADGFWDGKHGWGALRPDYLAHARERLMAARDAGLAPVLVMLWCCYAPDTWAARKAPAFVMPAEAVPDVLASAADAPDGFHPVYVVAGDTDFAGARTAVWYLRAQEELLRLVPDAVTTMHTQDTVLLPPAVADPPDLGFYCYQSGHRLELQHHAWEHAEHDGAARRPRPVVNLEPCYEGSGHGFRYGRFSAADVRRATSQSLLSGASAGIGCGAQRVRGWHRDGVGLDNPEFPGMPFDRGVALRFDGAEDVTFAAGLVERLGLIGVPGRLDLLDDPPEGVRAAAAGGLLAIDVHYAWEIALAPEVRDAVAWDLGARAERPAEVRERDGTIRLGQVPWNGDALLVVRLTRALDDGGTA